MNGRDNPDLYIPRRYEVGRIYIPRGNCNTINDMYKNTLPEHNDERWVTFFQTNRAAFNPGMMRPGNVSQAERTAIQNKFNEISANLDRYIQDQAARSRFGDQVFLEDHVDFSKQLRELFWLMKGREKPRQIYLGVGNSPGHYRHTLRFVRNELGTVLDRIQEMVSFGRERSPTTDNRSIRLYDSLRAECRDLRNGWFADLKERVFVDPGRPQDANQENFVAGTFNLMNELLFERMEEHRVRVLDNLCERLRRHIRNALRSQALRPDRPVRTYPVNVYPNPALGYPDLGYPDLAAGRSRLRRRRKRRRVDYYY